LRVRGSISTNTGIARSYSSALTEATKLNGVVMTSSPAEMPQARTARWRAAVPELTATAWAAPTQSAKTRSNSGRRGPRLSELV
jgi:hypothetical protein